MTYDKGMFLQLLCTCSLLALVGATNRDAIENAIGGSIELPSGTVSFSGGKISIGDHQSLTVTSDSGAVLDAGGTNNFFFVKQYGTLTLQGITLRKGNRYKGGAIYSEGSLTLTDCTFSSNIANNGGAIYSGGSLTLTDCTFSSNTAPEGRDVYFAGAISDYSFIGDASQVDLFCLNGVQNECPAPTTAAPVDASSNGDPHLQFADGGSADFRGSHNGIYNMLTSDGISVNALFREQDFYQSASGIEFARLGSERGEKFLVHGTFIFEAYTTLRTSSGRLLHLRAEATPVSVANVAFVENNVPVSQLDEHDERVVDNIKITTKDGVASIETPEWVVLCKIIRTDKSHFLNLSFKSITNAAAHGIIGQSYDHDGLAVDGAKDVYNSVPGGETTTTAQAEGAIEGNHSDYLMESPFATAYKYSLFNNKGAAVRDIRKLANTRVARERRKLAFLLQRMAGKENAVGAE